MTENLPFSSISIRCIGMDERKEAVFRMAFKMCTRRHYQLLDAGDTQASAVTIIDVDGAEGMAFAHRLHGEQPEQRILLTSVSPQEGGLFQVLRKPIRMETLFSALETLLNSGHSPELNGGHSPADPKVDGVASDCKQNAADAPAPPPATATSSISTRPAPLLRPEEIRHFNPQSGLLGLLRIAGRDPSPAIIVNDRQQVILRLDPMTDQAILLADDEHLKSLAREECPRLQMRAPNNTDVPAHASTRRLTLHSLCSGKWAHGRRMGVSVRISVSMFPCN